MTTLELLTPPGLGDTSRLEKMLAASRKRMIASYNRSMALQALANYRRKSQAK